MANRVLMVFENGQPRARQSQNETIDFTAVRIGTDFLTISDTSGNFDFANKKLTNIAPGTANGEALSYTQLGANNGIASLDAGGKIPTSQLPNSVMEFQGTWNASTNTPTLADGTGSAGDVYRVNVAGTQNLGSGAISYGVGDWVVYNGTIWQLAHAGADVVQSVNGQAGVVVLTTTDIAEGTNLYFTNARFDTRFNTDFALKTTTDLAEGTNLYYTNARFDTRFASKTTDNLTEGSTNLYFTTARARAAAVADAIVDGVTDVAPSQNAVFDALALKQDSLTSGDGIKIVSTTISADFAKSFVNDNASAITIRKVVYIKSNGAVDLAVATTAALADFELGLVEDASIAAAGTGKITVRHGAIIAGFSGLTPGKRQYVHATTAGSLTETAPSASGQFVYQVGRAISATEVKYEPSFIVEIV